MTGPKPRAASAASAAGACSIPIRTVPRVAIEALVVRLVAFDAVVAPAMKAPQ